MKKKLTCVTDGCQNEIGAGSITGLCKNCYSYIYNWQKRDAKDMVKRAMHMRLCETRMNFILPKNKVRIIGSKEPQQLAVLPGHVKKYRKRTKYKVLKSA